MNSFDEATHTYKIGGVKVPSVSEVIASLSDFSGVHPELLKRAGEYGSNCHKAIELYLGGELDYDTLDPHLSNVVSRFEEWQQQQTDYHFCDAIIETPCYHPGLKYGGTPDIVIPGNVVIDFKTSKYNPIAHDVQLAAYQLLAKANGGTGKEKLYVLELSESHYKQIEVKNSQAKNMFLYLLESYHRQEETKNKISQWKTFCLTK